MVMIAVNVTSAAAATTVGGEVTFSRPQAPFAPHHRRTSFLVRKKAALLDSLSSFASAVKVSEIFAIFYATRFLQPGGSLRSSTPPNGSLRRNVPILSSKLLRSVDNISVCSTAAFRGVSISRCRSPRSPRSPSALRASAMLTSDRIAPSASL